MKIPRLSNKEAVVLELLISKGAMYGLEMGPTKEGLNCMLRAQVVMAASILAVALATSREAVSSGMITEGMTKQEVLSEFLDELRTFTDRAGISLSLKAVIHD